MPRQYPGLPLAYAEVAVSSVAEQLRAELLRLAVAVDAGPTDAEAPAVVEAASLLTGAVVAGIPLAFAERRFARVLFDQVEAVDRQRRRDLASEKRASRRAAKTTPP